MNATKTVDPSKIVFHPSGKLTQPECFKLIKDGAAVPSNTLFDPVIMKFFNKLPAPTRANLIKDWASTSTALFKPDKGKKFGKRLVWSDEICTVTLLVPNVFANLVGMGIAIDLNRNNFEIIKYDGKKITLEISEKDAKIFELAPSFLWNSANESSLWIPAKMALDTTPFENRYFNVIDEAVAAVLARGSYGRRVFGFGLVYACRKPSDRLRVLLNSSVDDPTIDTKKDSHSGR